MKRRRPDLSRCPDCRERVTPFAAGCAICGADLDIGRFDGGPTLTQRAGSWVGALRTGPTIGRPRRSPSGFMEFAGSCVVAGAIVSVIGSLIYAALTLLG
jgi:hypothetical protein